MAGSGFCTVITESHGRGIRCQGAAISKLAGFKRLVHYGRFSCCTSGTLTIYYVAFCVAHLKQLFRIVKMLLLLLLLLLLLKLLRRTVRQARRTIGEKEIIIMIQRQVVKGGLVSTRSKNASGPKGVVVMVMMVM